MYGIVRCCVLPPLSAEQRERLLTQAALQSLASIFEAVPDPAKRMDCAMVERSLLESNHSQTLFLLPGLFVNRQER